MINRIFNRDSSLTKIIPWFVLFTAASATFPAIAANGMSADKAAVVKFWTKERMGNAIPRDLVIDSRGLGYLRKPDGTLVPHGHDVSAEINSQSPLAGKPSGGGTTGDTTPPSITNMDPSNGAVIGASYQFSATVTDDLSGVKSVSFVIIYPDGRTQSFSPQKNGDIWSTTLQGFTNGNWKWRVDAKDGAPKGGNSTSSADVQFTVETNSSGTGSGDTGGGSGGYIITSQAWSAGGTVQTAAGRIYFQMPRNSKRSSWTGYVCSGTVATDGTTGRSVILTASHCVYDDANKAFARNVLFIPDQADTSGAGTDLNCDNDPLGCWVPSFGVVDNNWTTRTFPDNIAWDYAFYVVADAGAHSGTAATSNALDVAADSLPISFLQPFSDDGDPSATSVDFTHAMGYSYSEDPKFMYCAEDMTTNGAVNWWLPSCGLSGGSSGGPWIQPMDTATGSGNIISVNSWGYTSSPGMAGPKLSGTSANCIFGEAKGVDFASVSVSDGDAGVAVDYCP